MPMPLKHKKSRQKHRKEGAKPDPTAKYRVRFWREAKSHDMTVPQYRAYLEEQFRRRRARAADYAERRRRLFGFDLLDEFAAITGGTVTDYESTRVLWKRNAVRLHPDRPDGDAVKAARLNELWTSIQKLRGWNHAS